VPRSKARTIVNPAEDSCSSTPTILQQEISESISLVLPQAPQDLPQNQIHWFRVLTCNPNPSNLESVNNTSLQYRGSTNEAAETIVVRQSAEYLDPPDILAHHERLIDM